MRASCGGRECGDSGSFLLLEFGVIGSKGRSRPAWSHSPTYLSCEYIMVGFCSATTLVLICGYIMIECSSKTPKSICKAIEPSDAILSYPYHNYITLLGPLQLPYQVP